ncbi:MAG: hypothetical protein C0502_04640 [Opitutus sp.]|nr:hypothetical protein [Opitutus sp.]
MKTLRLFRLVLPLLAAGAAHARLGETAAEIRQRFGRPESQPNKNVMVWLIEESAGALVYTVTFDEKGGSIAEGLKPFRQAGFAEQSALNFIEDQLAVLRDPRAARVVRPGESYTFGGETLKCGEHEHIVVDDANDLLLVWTKRPSPSVLAVTHEMLRRTRR